MGVCNTERCQDFSLYPLHVFGFDVGLVIEAQQVQQAVDHEMLEVMRWRNVTGY